MNRASRHLPAGDVTVLITFRVAVIALLVCIFQHVTLTAGKVFERCELAQVLRYGHGVDVNEVANWVCIAQHSSSLDTSAFGGNARIGSHGIFQISDEYWCSPPGKVDACGITCDKLRDDDISDDFECVKKIHDEHQGLSGDGFNAWQAYQVYCKDNPYEYIEDCFGNEEREYIRSKSITTNYVRDEEEESFDSKHSRGKVYGRCELAKELFLKHKIPMDEIPTWVCIAQHESNYDTSAVGRLNSDGSADHGLFQISDLFWCSKKGGQRKACGVPCSKFLDSDITDDVKCIRQIHKEHTRISGDGFNAWTVYNAHCHEASEKYIRGCFDGIDVEDSKRSQQYKTYDKPNKGDVGKPHGKVYQPCELAEDLRTKYHLPEDQIATWVCIAKHESGYNTSAIGYGDHGLFQISDIYWCSPPGKGWACGLSCSDLEDSDISDDIECVRKIYDEHSHLSGDGFKAWSVYPRYCSNGRAEKYISHCPNRSGSLRGAVSHSSYSKPISSNSIEDYHPAAKGKIYGRCELANELLNKYHMPEEEISTWVCIAHHESNFDTSAVGRLNADGSSDHGLFQISGLFWCSDDADEYGKACGLPCSKLLDSDISDDVECVKQIHDEHTRISGDGFNAWSVYNAYCKDSVEQYTRGCFDGSASVEDFEPIQRTVGFEFKSKNKPKGKVYEDCELAKELRDKHHIPKEQISSWVCIAKHQSGLNTSARSADSHGMFYISDEYWCSPPGKGKACELHCSDLEDSDITDDVDCVKKIYEEHQRIFGNGFNAWRVYDQHCSNGRADDYINQCLGFESTARNSISYGSNDNNQFNKFGGRSLDLSKPLFDHAFNANPFLKHVDIPGKQTAVKTNSIFNQFQTINSFQGNAGEFFSASEDAPTVNNEYAQNPFLKYVPSLTQKPAVQQVRTTTAVPTWRNPWSQTTTTLSYPIFNNFHTGSKKTATKVKPFAWSAPSPTLSEEKAKYEIYKTFTTPSPPAFTVTPKANRLQPYHLNTIKSFETTAAPFWLTTTTSKPTSFNSQNSVVGTPFWLTTTTAKPSSTATPFWRTSTTSKPITTRKSATVTPFWQSSSTQKPTTTKTPFWVTTTTQKPTTRSNTASPFGAVPFWLASTTTSPPTTNRFQFFQPSSSNKTLTTTSTPFWLTSTTQKPTSRLSTASPFGNVPFWLTSTTKSTTRSTTTTTRSPISSKISSLALPTFQTAPLKTSTKLFNSPSTTKAPQKSAAHDSGQYNPGRYNSGRYVSGKNDTPRNNSTTQKPTTTTRTTKSPWTSKVIVSTTSKTTKYDPFRQFPPTTLKPKTTTSSIWNSRSTTTKTPPSSTRNYFQYNSTPTKSTTTTTAKPFVGKWTTSKPFSYPTIKTNSPTTTKSTTKFSFQFTTPPTKVTSSTSKPISSPTTQRSYIAPSRTQTQKPIVSQTIIPPWAVTTTRAPTTTVSNTTKSKKPSESSGSSSRNDLYDLYSKLYGISPTSG